MHVYLFIDPIHIYAHIHKHARIIIIHTHFTYFNICIFNTDLYEYICLCASVFIRVFLYLDFFHFTKPPKDHQY